MRIPSTITTERANCILWGGYGWGNFGDDLTLAVALRDARAQFGERLSILSRNPAHTSRLFPDAQVIHYQPRRPPRWQRELWRHRRWLKLPLAHYRLRDQQPQDAWVTATRGAGQFWLVGGGYLNELGPWEYFLLPVQLAKASGIAVHTAPLGLGPFVTGRAAKAVAAGLRDTELSVRDAVSAEFCRAHGLRAQHRQDDGYRLREVVADLPGQAPKERQRIGICIFRQGDDHTWPRTERWWFALLQQLRQANQDIEVEGFCFHSDTRLDLYWTRALLETSGWSAEATQQPAGDFRSALRQLGRYAVVISARYHAVVAASALGIPCVGVVAGEYYQAKMDSVGNSVNPAVDSPASVAQRLLNAVREGALA